MNQIEWKIGDVIRYYRDRLLYPRYGEKIPTPDEIAHQIAQLRPQGGNRPGLGKETIGQWTARVNAIVDILKIEMDGGFLEDTAKYKDSSKELIYSCLRAVAVQILALIDAEIAEIYKKLRMIMSESESPDLRTLERNIADFLGDSPLP